VAALAAGRLCQGPRQQACRLENGAYADWACQECREFLKPEAISAWTWHLVFLHRLKRAGYPFRANDLSLETWILLGAVGEVMEQGRKIRALRGRQGDKG
jgi:hypothetical protein